jgi:hypothetical protein
MTQPYYLILDKMKIENNNLYTHLIFTTIHKILWKTLNLFEKYKFQ